MKDYQHASRLFVDENFKLLPKQKFLYHVFFDIDNDIKPFSTNERYELNMLVKTCELPKYDMNLEERLEYNKKVYIGTRIVYRPVTIAFHDDHADTVNAFWKAYYEYNIADSLTINRGSPTQTKDDYYSKDRVATQFGMDNVQKRKKPFLRSIQIFALKKKRFTSYTLINPVIGSFSHDNFDAADGGGTMTNTMQVFYETVLYNAGKITKSDVPGFATVHYDFEPSPLSVLGGGTTSIFGPGGIIDGIGSVINDVRTGNVNIGTIFKGINTYNNAKKIKAKEAVKEELKGIVKKSVQTLGTSAGTITNPITNYKLGSTAGTLLAVGTTIATAKNLIDQKNKNSNQINVNVVQNFTDILSPTESFNFLQNNLQARDKVASSLYYKLNGSRRGLSIAESDVEYASLNNASKNIYRSRALTDVTKLVNEGYIKISRENFEVGIEAEKVII